MLFQLYIFISILCALAYAIELMLTKLGYMKMQDIFSVMEETNKLLEDINNEKLTNFINNFIDVIIGNPMVGIFVTFFISFTPILHISFLYSEIQIFKTNRIK
jgi:hypothetical protein